jgi:hypothetical protein
MIGSILQHASFGALFAVTGAFARNQLCRHWHHQLIVGGVAILLEAIVMVNVVG